MVLFCWVNMLNYMDRGIVSGGFELINQFILETLPSANASNVDAYRGFLTSSFIISYAVSALVFGHLVHRFPPFKLMSFGLLIWCVAVLICSASPNYWVLLVGRALSGVGEASFQCVVPPFIDDNAGKANRAKWLAFFYAMIPFGTAVGYGWSDLVGESLGWQWSFGLEAPLMAPALLVCFFLPYHKRGEATHVADAEAPIRPDTRKPEGRELGVFQELGRVLGSPIYLAVSFGYAAYTASVAGFAAFGPQFVFDLGLVSSRGTASILFGGVIAVTGFTGTALGGMMLDRMQLADDSAQRARLGLMKDGRMVVSAMSLEEEGGAQPVEEEYDEEGVMAMEIEGASPPSLGTGRGAFEDHVASIDGASAAERRERAGDREDGEETEEDATSLRQLDTKLCASLRQATLLTAAGMLTTLAAPFLVEAGLWPFLASLALGTMFLFATTAGVNIAVMASVPSESRPFAIGLATAITHAFGDVPSPVLIGLISDDLAPNVPGKARSRPGLEHTLLIVTCWIVWAVLLWGAAWLWARSRRSFNERHRTYEELGGDGRLVWRVCGTSRPEDDADLRRPLTR